MKQSLKTVLNDWIERDSYITYNDVEVYCNQYHYRIGTALRRLRELENIKPVFKKSYIIRWEWAGEPTQESLKI